MPTLKDGAIARKNAGAPAWKKLEKWCNEKSKQPVFDPETGYDTDAGRIGPGYQGGDYAYSVANLGLCWQLTGKQPYAKKGVEVLLAMSHPNPPKAPNPLADSGYGIRFYGVGMALGFDWLYEALSTEQRQRVITALNRWIDAYEKGGFEREHPVANYFAGYYAAKALAALATEGDDPRAEKNWRDWLERLHGKMVVPFYGKHIAGGGWPEGWNYGPLATLNMALPTLAAQTAKGIDLLKDFRFPVEQAEHLIHFAWPTRATLDDRGAQYQGDNPARANPQLFTVMAGLLEAWKQPLAPQFHKLAREVRALDKESWPSWEELLFWNPSAPEAAYETMQRSYFARGMNTIAMRSSWERDAVWGSFTSGTYVGSGGSGEMYFDQGSLVVVKGGRGILVNTVGALNRHTPGTNDGAKVYDPIYNDLFGNHDADPSAANRTIFNVFYARSSHMGQLAFGPDRARTHVDHFEDRGDWVRMRGVQLENMIRQPKRSPHPVRRWTRQVLFVRPSLFIVDDETEITDGNNDQWLAWHVPAGGAKVVTALLPRGAKTTLVDVFGFHKVDRVEVRPAAPEAKLRWLTAIDAGSAKLSVDGDDLRVELDGKKLVVRKQAGLLVVE